MRVYRLIVQFHYCAYLSNYFYLYFDRFHKYYNIYKIYREFRLFVLPFVLKVNDSQKLKKKLKLI